MVDLRSTTICISIQIPNGDLRSPTIFLTPLIPAHPRAACRHSQLINERDSHPRRQELTHTSAQGAAHRHSQTNTHMVLPSIAAACATAALAAPAGTTTR